MTEIFIRDLSVLPPHLQRADNGRRRKLKGP
jgi:hypothetical protein